MPSAPDFGQAVPSRAGLVLPALDAAGAVLLTELVLACLCRRGLAVSASVAGTIRLANGTSFGLHNLSTVAAQRPRRDWPGLVERHFGAIQHAGSDQQDYSHDPARWYFKLRLAAELPQPSDYAQQVLPGVLALAAIDTPSVVHEAVTRAGKPWLDDLAGFTERAIANLAALAAPELISVHADPKLATSRVYLFQTEDYYGASRLLVLPRLLREHLGVVESEAGYLVAVPHRHLLIAHRISDTPALLAAIRLIGPLAEREHHAKPGPISPHVYLLSGDAPAEQVSRFTEDGLAVQAGGRFGALLLSLPAED